MPRPRALIGDPHQACEGSMQQQPRSQQGGEDAEVCSETLQVRLQHILVRAVRLALAEAAPFCCTEQ